MGLLFPNPIYGGPGAEDCDLATSSRPQHFTASYPSQRAARWLYAAVAVACLVAVVALALAASSSPAACSCDTAAAPSADSRLQTLTDLVAALELRLDSLNVTVGGLSAQSRSHSVDLRGSQPFFTSDNLRPGWSRLPRQCYG